MSISKSELGGHGSLMKIEIRRLDALFLLGQGASRVRLIENALTQVTFEVQVEPPSPHWTADLLIIRGPSSNQIEAACRKIFKLISEYWAVLAVHNEYDPDVISLMKIPKAAVLGVTGKDFKGLKELCAHNVRLHIPTINEKLMQSADYDFFVLMGRQGEINDVKETMASLIAELLKTGAEDVVSAGEADSLLRRLICLRRSRQAKVKLPRLREIWDEMQEENEKEEETELARKRKVDEDGIDDAKTKMPKLEERTQL